MHLRWDDVGPDEVPLGGHYRQVLRALGSYLNLQGARYLSLEIIMDRFVWRFSPRADQSRSERGESTAAALLSLDDSYGQMLRGKGRRRWLARPSAPLPLEWHPLVPEGYDRALGAVGAWLDRYDLRLVRIQEHEEDLHVWYARPPGRRANTATLGREQLAALQRTARDMRNHEEGY